MEMIFYTAIALILLFSIVRAFGQMQLVRVQKEANYLSKEHLSLTRANRRLAEDQFEFFKKKHISETDEKIQETVRDSIDERVRVFLDGDVNLLEVIVKNQILTAKLANRDMESALGIESE